MNLARRPSQLRRMVRWRDKSVRSHFRFLAELFFLAIILALPFQSAQASNLEVLSQSDDQKSDSPPATKPSPSSASETSAKPITDPNARQSTTASGGTTSGQSQTETKPKTDDKKPANAAGISTPIPTTPPSAQNAANPLPRPAAAAPPSFGQLGAGQGQLQSRNNVPGFFGDFFAPGGNVLNVPGTPIHNSPQTPGATPLALGFASVSTPGTPTPAQLYFRSVNTSGPMSNPFVPAAGTENYVYRTNVPGINNTTTPPTYQLNTIPPNSANPVGYFIPFTSTQVNTGPGFIGQLGTLQSAPPTSVNGHPLNDVIAVGAPITKFGTTQSAVDTVYAFFSDTQPPNYHAQPIVFTGGAGSMTQVPILSVLTSNTSTSVYSPSLAAGGVQKLVDNASPVPRDRVFFNYSYFQNSAIVVDGHAINVNRLTPGFEKTFFNQLMSVEVRVPFATTIDSVNLTGVTNTSNILLGNQTTYLKALLYTDSKLSIASGLGIQLPTAASTQYSVNGYSIKAVDGAYTQTSSIDILKIRNEAVHLMPYLGSVYTPNDRFFAQSVAQLDFATNGNTVYNAAVYPVLNDSNPDPATWTVTSATTGLSRAGSLNDTNFMYLSANTGYWIYKTTNPYERGLTGFAPTIEMHYNQSLQREDTVSGFYGNPGQGTKNISQLNGVIGATTVFGNDKYLSVGYVLPFETGVNRAYDGELRVMFNYYFGAPRVNPRFRNVPSF